MIAKHTPRPWRRSGNQILISGGYFSLSYSSARKTTREASRAERNANLDLIAASPDLLAALEEIAEWESCECQWSPEEKIRHFRRVAYAAVAKAEGRAK